MLGFIAAIVAVLGVVLTPQHSAYRETVRVTHYWWTGYPMASGDYPFVGAVATNALPLYSWIQTPDGLWWQVLDRCGGCGGAMWIDFYGFDAESVYGTYTDIEIY